MGKTKQLIVVKIGGNVIDDQDKLDSFLEEFSRIEQKKILVHGGGKLANRLAERLGIPQQVVDGRRITDEQTLKLVTMVYAGLVNKQVVAKLQGFGCQALGLCGADADLIRSHRRSNAAIEYGLVGDIDKVNAQTLEKMLDMDLVPVIAPLTHDGSGQLLNTNADSIAQEVAKSLSYHYAVHLIYCFEKEGVLADLNDEQTVIGQINLQTYQELKQNQVIVAGMIPKLDNAFSAIDQGVERVIIGKADKLSKLCTGEAGTTISRS